MPRRQKNIGEYPGPERKWIAPIPGNGPLDFTVHQLTVFRTVAQHLSYTRAAEALYLSQPAVAQQIKTLEQVLGLRLFIRRGRGIVLTPVGQEFLSHAERILTLLAETTPIVHEIHTLERGSVLVGASTSAGTYIVPPLLGAFHSRYPRVHVTLMVAHRHAIEEHLLTHQVDLAVMGLIEQQDRLVVEFLRPYELVMVSSPSHRLAGRSALSLHDLQAETLLLREQESATRLATEQHFAQAGVPLPAAGIGQHRSDQGRGSRRVRDCGALRESIALEIANGVLVVLDVQGFPLKRQWYIVHLKGRKLSRSANALRQLLLQTRIGSS